MVNALFRQGNTSVGIHRKMKFNAIGNSGKRAETVFFIWLVLLANIVVSAVSIAVAAQGATVQRH